MSSVEGGLCELVRPSPYTILHVNDTAAQSSMAAAGLPEYKHLVLALQSTDPFNLRCRYTTDGWATTKSRTAYYARLMYGSMRADLVHLNGVVAERQVGGVVRGMMNQIRGLSLRFARSTPYIIHYHGSEVRATPPERRAEFESAAAAVLVSTPDLLEHEYAVEPTLMNTMVDVEMFSPRKVPQNGRGLCMLKHLQPVDLTRKLLSDAGFGDVGWDLVRRSPNPEFPHDLADGVIHSGIPYVEMPDRLAKYEYYADISTSRGVLTDARSITGLQAASVGCKVIDIYGNVLKSVPSEHRPENVRCKLDVLYRRMLGDSR